MKFSTGATVLSGIASLVAAAPYPDNSNTKQVEIKESTIICVKDTKHCFSSIKDIAATVTRESGDISSDYHAWDVDRRRYGPHSELAKGQLVFSPITHVEYRLEQRAEVAIYIYIGGRDLGAGESGQPEPGLEEVQLNVADGQSSQVDEEVQPTIVEGSDNEKYGLLRRYQYETKIRTISINADFTFTHNGHRYRVIERASAVKVYFAKGERKMAREALPSPNGEGSNERRTRITIRTNEEVFIGGRHVKLAESITITVIQLD